MSTERFDDGWLELDGLRLHYTEWGPPTAQPVLLLHGLNVQCRTWDPFARELADRYHVIAMDLRGHGDSDWARSGYRVRSMARDVQGLIDALGLGPVHLVGHSAGVRVGIAVVGEKPWTVRRLALSDAGPANSKAGAVAMRDFHQGDDKPAPLQGRGRGAGVLSHVPPGVAARVHRPPRKVSATAQLGGQAGAEGVVGPHFGYIDYAADVGSRPFADSGDELFAPSNHYAQAKIAVTAAAYGLFATGGTLIPDYRDLEKVRRFVRRWADLGYTACIGLSPAHLGIINELMGPSAEQVREATEVCACYEDAQRRGEPAAVLRGKVITMPDYRVARLTISRAR